MFMSVCGLQSAWSIPGALREGLLIFNQHTQEQLPSFLPWAGGEQAGGSGVSGAKPRSKEGRGATYCPKRLEKNITKIEQVSEVGEKPTTDNEGSVKNIVSVTRMRRWGF